MQRGQSAFGVGSTSLTGRLFFLLLVTIISSVLIASSRPENAAAQGKQEKLDYGVIYSCSNSTEFKVISCDDKDWCQVFMVNKYSPGGGNIAGQGKDTVLSTIRKNECTVKGRAQAPEKPMEAVDKDDPTKEPGQAADNAPAGCPSDPNLTTKTKPNESMELNSKRAILARFQQAVDKKEKVAVGITFENFQIGPPRTNLRGSTLYNEDAPVGAKIYPIKSKFTLCSLFSTEITRDVTDGRYECFKDNFGDWSCGTASGYRIVNSTYEKKPR